MLKVVDLGTRAYADVWKTQQELVQARARSEIPNTILFVEHLPVITQGRRSSDDEILEKKFPIFKIERGGRATYHGPGQLVGYPIVGLKELKLGIKEFMGTLEEILIRSLSEFDISAGRKVGATGVWVGDKKIASIGVAVKQWVTYHGFALNVSTSLDDFRAISPCGFKASVMTSMLEQTGKRFPLQEVKSVVEKYSHQFLSSA